SWKLSGGKAWSSGVTKVSKKRQVRRAVRRSSRASSADIGAACSGAGGRLIQRATAGAAAQSSSGRSGQLQTCQDQGWWRRAAGIGTGAGGEGRRRPPGRRRPASRRSRRPPPVGRRARGRAPARPSPAPPSPIGGDGGG